MGLPDSQFITIPEYLEIEARTGMKHEYLNGVVKALTGGSLEHAAVSAQIGHLLTNHLKGKPCRPFGSDLKIKAAGKTMYPDVAVVCQPMRRDPEMRDAVTNPKVVIEVLSESTAAYDRSEKFGFYRQNMEMTDYVLVDPLRQYAEHYTRIKGDSWNLEFLGPESVLRLPSIECVVPLREFYEGMELLADAPV